jgi:hypothetical protein
MPKRIVHALEAIEIEAVHCDLLVAWYAFEGILDLFPEQAPIGQIRQGIVSRHVVDPLCGKAPFGDVLMRGNPSPAIHRLMDDADDMAVAELGFAQHAFLGRYDRHDASDVGFSIRALDIVRAQAVLEQLAQMGTRLGDLARKPVHLAIQVIADDEPLAGVEHHQTDGQVVDRGLQQLLLRSWPDLVRRENGIAPRGTECHDGSRQSLFETLRTRPGHHAHQGPSN